MADQTFYRRTTSSGLRRVTRLVREMAEELGASAVMVTPSREPTPNPEKIFEYTDPKIKNKLLPQKSDI